MKFKVGHCNTNHGSVCDADRLHRVKQLAGRCSGNKTYAAHCCSTITWFVKTRIGFRESCGLLDTLSGFAHTVRWRYVSGVSVPNEFALRRTWQLASVKGN